VAQCSAIVHVMDTIRPLVLCNNVTITLNNNGQISIGAQDVDAGSTDNCEIDTMFLDKYDFTCADVGEAVDVTLTVVDVNGNANSHTAAVAVADYIPPTVVTRDIEVYLNSSGKASIVTSDVDNGSWD